MRPFSVSFKHCVVCVSITISYIFCTLSHIFHSFVVWLHGETNPNCKSVFFSGNPAKPDESFGGDFYKDFYYSQGDYSQEEAQETKEMKKKKTKA